jgi:2-methylcitrate dehydratase PrpD
MSGAADPSTRAAGATSALVELASSLHFADLSDGNVDLIRLAFLDAVGCMLAGAGNEDSEPVAAWVSAIGGAPESVVIGGGRAPASLAALVNGTSAHALDLDDFSATMMHPSVCLVPTVLALGERERVDGRRAIAAYAAGFEVMARLCRTLNPGHYARGWHSTSTAGVVGAAVAAGVLLGLDRTELARAIGIAASWSGGLRDNFGSAVKPLHAGSAGLHGVAAAELAARGMTGSETILDGERGFLQVMGDGVLELDAITAPALELDRSGIAFKQYACCGAIHTALDGLLDLRAEHGLTAADVASVTCAVNRWAPEILIHHVASTPAEGRFCVEYSLAVALTDGEAGLLQYTDERIADQAVHELARRVAVVVDESLTVDRTAFPATITIETRDGRRLEAHVERARGTPESPLPAASLAEKFRACAAGTLPGERAERVLSAILGLDAVEDVGELALLLEDV